MHASTVRKLLKKVLRFRFKKVYGIIPQTNSEKSKKLRSIGSYFYCKQVLNGKIIINVDESSIDRTCYVRRGWEIAGKQATIASNNRLYKKGLIAAITSAGSMFYSVFHGSQDSHAVWFFLLRVCVVLQ